MPVILTKNRYINTCQIINRYTAINTVMYEYGCNRKFYNTHVPPHCTNTKGISDDTTIERYPIILKLQNVWDNTIKQRKQSFLSTVRQKIVSDNVTKEKYQFLAVLPS